MIVMAVVLTVARGAWPGALAVGSDNLPFGFGSKFGVSSMLNPFLNEVSLKCLQVACLTLKP